MFSLCRPSQPQHSAVLLSNPAADAKLLADLVRTDRHNHRSMASDSSEAEAIKVLARGHQNLIWARTRHTNALRSAPARSRCHPR
ncbi:hypothetical protein AWC00_12990 [Mycobacterium conspicuum]|nr:hypothetical protein AWC00_12990 [Mycobacterium conspicuum]